MKRLTLIALLVAATVGLTCFAAQPTMKKEKLFHVVSLKFKASAKPEDIKKVEAAFADLKNKIPQIATLEWGTNNSPEKHDKGFTHCFVLCFDDDKARDVYLTHPDHQTFGKLVGPLLDDVFVIDFVARK